MDLIIKIVYKGKLSDGQIVAIKRSQKGSKQGGLEFKTEIEMLSRVHHKNLVELVGFCFEKGERMLVYEYISNGTLSDNLDVKSSNILLDDNSTAKVADFGLSMLLLDSDRGHVSTTVKGTLGYLDPEYFMTQQLTAKSDVYSFGVVMMELINLRMPIEKGKYIVREVRTRLDKSEKELYGLKDILDPALVEDGCLIGFWRFVELALQCVEDSSEDRPTMNDIIKEIENILKDDELKEKPNSAYLSATSVEHANGAPIQAYDEMLLSREVNTRSDATRSDRYTYSE
ncbi:leucine-rich repeat receptor protein kinase HPCA1-like [Curcuma longa]|uniref:leucine-rich repeat receptor protein kinase HPCA1-like n=1 Tax=Curcuma longa TaxID=136217 RepID=UPI003D9E1962